MTFVRTYRFEIAIVVLALVVRFACFFVVIDANQGSVVGAIHGDDGYFEITTNVLAGNGFSSATTSPYIPNPLRTPGYIYFLAGLLAATGSYAVVATIQILLSTLIPLLGMRIARHLTGSQSIALAAGIILALDPTLALLSFQFYTETLFVVLFFIWLLLTFRYLEKPSPTTLVLGAAVLGFAILTKTTVQYLPLIMVPFILWRHGRTDMRRGAAHVAVYLCIVGAILAPWVMRNVRDFGTAGLSAQTPFVLYTNLAPAVLSIANNTPFADELKTFLTPAEYQGTVITLANGGEYSARALEIVRAHPAATFFVATKSLFTFFTNDGFYTLLARSGHTPTDFLPLLIAARLVWIAITIAAFIGALVYLLTRRSQLAILVILLVAYFALTSTIAAFGTNPRYRLPVDPVIIALAGIGCTSLIALLRRRKLFLE
ncbi:hypothetical protein A3C20_00890 [Candidatus Kaiserbacteria bacterium RIFCSPHIGHO2_02_FULL_55_25]|uniref:Glycosyltransferase RgtA/B/C/D-like domain-containing protein n=1 Tax=Candidatus Kaiserbacteria bacterium RIFCSPHIGHO2_02_FULL_55_25 TaxID=1798498 RepID=A0A1F6E6W9_9BACT|nr:MAG: hypothetical protein A2764_03930 [Candidatus Kaiserbacteria bacterium RIFCSPHIGHO2_01_FULL_55_79]OGG69444.1 MAG: hypothetical protein A3C20_00890 [Candidatus Kaiserbacteria bacterium RIFCSPHIGHO2_02_FULL_55_25]OGG77626.1 MAG: hypothetical protein A3F56_00950 [Candidatus Kaiserbacteria bacterium RIFCSPHIGHO2_12_FULL_55_13]OGG83109.1 MAG: hypothetical protein A3A42_00600 [Candidatus Kaiserbacteria bacterium RIFCSPLOWO2_01_FULL_55_25]